VEVDDERRGARRAAERGDDGDRIRQRSARGGRRLTVPTLASDPLGSFRHEIFTYRSDEEYLAGTVPFIEEGLAGGEAVLVVLPEVRLELVRSRLSPADVARASLVPMEEAGRNPARLIAAVADVVAASTATAATSGPAVRGIGEPIWPERPTDEVDECLRHEELLNLAFRAADGLRLRCPYDAAALDGSVLRRACRSHPWLHAAGGPRPTPSFRPEVERWVDGSLPAPPPEVEAVSFDRSTLRAVRHRAGREAGDAGCAPPQVDDVVLAVSEAVTNSVRHGGGHGTARFWTTRGALYCEVRDSGCITDPLAGLLRPSADQLQGRGLWLIQQVCDLVQVRCDVEGQTLRLRFDR
jgi:anti-sigma regulatory factor (Ser/Thr protein kinase)